MALNIKNSEADRLARELSELTGESITETVIVSLAQRLEREKRKQTTVVPLKEELLQIARRFQRLPTIDERSEAEILGIDDGD